MFKVNNRNTRARCEICSKLTIKIPERRQVNNIHTRKKTLYLQVFSQIGKKMKKLG